MTQKLEGPSYVLEAKSFTIDPSQDELTKLTEAMPNSRWTKYGNLNVTTRVVSRSAGSTYIVTDEPERFTGLKTITRAEYERIASVQEDYIREQDMVVINGFIGNDDDFKTAARLVIEAANANIAGSQDHLYFGGEFDQPEVTVIYTPNLKAEGYPDDRLIAVDLDNMVTRVLYSDYFGESKKGGLRMWNKIVYDRGGLSLHAGCKVIPSTDGDKTFLIIGLSGTGKTTTTFTRQNDSKPVQDDFIALMPGGKVHGTENGCFAKTYALSEEYEPTIYGAVTQPGAYLENVSQQEEHGDVDFFDESFTQNGRAVFAMEKLGWYLDPREIGAVENLLILNRNDNIIPAVARLPKEAAAAYFMLGETMGTAAGGKDEAGKALRVPGTNPFFPMPHALQGNRFLELMRSTDLHIYLMNTGWVGGGDGDDNAKKVKIPHSSAVVKAIADGTITWERDPDFGYEVATEIPGFDDPELLQPKRLYERQGRLDEYEAHVARLRSEREAFLKGFEGLDPEILAAIL